MRARRHSISVFAIASSALFAALFGGACKRGGEDVSPAGVDAGGFDKAALLRAWGQCVLDGANELKVAASSFETAARKAESERTPASRVAAQDAWKAAVDAVERLELFGFGPAAPSTAPGGRDLRDAIYAWPLVNRCLIEQQLVDRVYDAPSFGATLLNGRSLAAGEYVLFYEGTDHACGPDAKIASSGAWAALGAAELSQRKLAYARAVAVDAAAHAGELARAWDPLGENFLNEWSGAGNTKTFGSQQLAFNAASSAFFYIDDFVKNMKVGKPSGLATGCATPPCLDAVESPWAHRAKEHLKNNLLGFDRMLRGCGKDGQGLGWDDLLSALGPQAADLASKMDAAVSACRDALVALNESTFEWDVQRNMPGVRRLYDALRAVVVLMKTEFISILDLELPKRVEGDND
jgi:predicted lipoprotein